MTAPLVQKVRYIYLPFLLVSGLLVAGYTFLNWLVLYEVALFSIDEEVVNFWLPFALVSLVVFVWIRPRVATLRVGRGIDFYCVMAGSAIAVPLIIAQLWLSEAAGGITQIESPSAIEQVPKTKYYRIASVSVDKAHSSRYTISSYQGRHNETLEIACYFVCPFGTPMDTELVWLATVYKERMSSHLADDKRESAIQAFMAQSRERYEGEDLTRNTYFSRAGKNTDLRGFEAALAHNPWHRKGAPATLLLRHTDDYESRSGSKLAWAFGSFGIGASVWFLLLLFVSIDARAAKNPRKANPRDAIFAEGNFLWPRRGFFATPLIIDINLLVFIGMVLAGLGVMSVSAPDLLAIGGNFRPALLEGQLWRLVSSMFIHAGAMHLFGNLTSLVFAGMLLERGMGSRWFAGCFLVCGIAGGIASALVHPATVAVGASGGIFGLWGVLLVLGLTKSKHVEGQFKSVVMLAVVTIGYNILLGLASTGIDNAAHLGGLAAGAIFGGAARLFPNVFLRGATSATRSTSTPQANVVGN